MNKKIAFGTAAAATAVLALGAAAPAMASDSDYTSLSKWSSRSDTTHTTTNTVFTPDLSVGNGDILNGNSVGSGNDTAIGNGNETAVGNVSDNSVSTDVSDVVDNATHTSATDFVDVDDIIGDVSGWVDLTGMFED